MSEATKISACLVVYNEESVIERCLASVKDLVDEIIVVHDGECIDKTLAIAKKFTDKIFVREHIGEAEPHRVFALNQATGDWILQIDGDEYLEISNHQKIRDLINQSRCDGYIFQWELWDGKEPVHFKGLQKMCLYRKANFHYLGVPHQIGSVDKGPEILDLFLRHRPIYNNISWKSFLKKKRGWVPIHARYFFPELVFYESFNYPVEDWKKNSYLIRKNIAKYIIIEPIINLLGQLKNGLWTSGVGINIALQQYIYYLSLYLKVWKLKKTYGK